MVDLSFDSLISPLMTLITAVCAGSYYRGKIEGKQSSLDKKIDEFNDKSSEYHEKTDELSLSHAVLEEKTRSLSNSVEGMPLMCKNQRDSIMEEIRRELPLIIAASMNKLILQNLGHVSKVKDDIGAVKTDVEVMKRDVKAIFKMLDRRSAAERRNDEDNIQMTP